MDIDFWVLADRTHPVLLKIVTGSDVLQVVRIEVPGALADIEAALTARCEAELPGVYFAFNSAELESDSEPAIADARRLVDRHPEWNLVIEGHTDSIGGASANQSLSLRRAESVRAALVRAGVPAARLRSAGVGASRPRESNATLEGRASNRRVELTRPCPPARLDDHLGHNEVRHASSNAVPAHSRHRTSPNGNGGMRPERRVQPAGRASRRFLGARHRCDGLARPPGDTRATREHGPCAWLPRDSVERILGPLAATPVRIAGAELADPLPDGNGCLYQPRLSPGGEPYGLAVEVIIDGGLTLETGLGASLPGMAERSSRQRRRPVRQRPRVVWTGWVASPGSMARDAGTFAILMGDQAPVVRQGASRYARRANRQRHSGSAVHAGGRRPAGDGNRPEPVRAGHGVRSHRDTGRDVGGSVSLATVGSLVRGDGASCSYYLGTHHV